MRYRVTPEKGRLTVTTFDSRSVYDGGVHDPGWSCYDNQRTVDQPDMPYYSNLSAIYDVVSAKEHRGRWNPCKHRTLKIQEPYSYCITKTRPDWRPACSANGISYPASQTYGQVSANPIRCIRPDEIPSPHLPVDIGSLRQQAIVDALGFLEPGALSLVSLAELFSIKKSLSGLIDIAKQLKFSSLKSLLKTAARGELSYRFFIRQFIADVKAVFKTLRRVEEQMRQFHSRNMLEKFTVSKRAMSTQNNITTVGAFSVQAQGQYTMDDVQFAHLVADTLGTNRLASSLWDVIPFSFVVDYFLNIGDIIQGLEYTSLSRSRANNIMLLQACYSYCTTTEYQYEHTANLLCFPEPFYGGQWSYIDKIYERHIVPVGSLIPDISFNNANAWEWHTIGAVVLSK